MAGGAGSRKARRYLIPVCQPASSVTLFDSGAADSMTNQESTMSASRARASVQQPAAADRLSETLRTVAANPAPANTARNAAIDDANARWLRTPRGMAFMLEAWSDDYTILLDQMECLLHRIADAATEDGNSARLLCQVAQGWVANTRDNATSFRQRAEAAIADMRREAQA